MKIAIIGAGLSGLTLANRLSAVHDIEVFEKARGPGGRMSTRRAAPYAFDHGAQYFTAESERFQAFIGTLEAQGLIANWPRDLRLTSGARVSDKAKYIAVPGMNALCKHLAEALSVHTQVHVESVSSGADGWNISAKDRTVHGPFDWVVSTAPAEQSAALLPGSFSGQTALREVEMHGCFALMLGFETPLALEWQALKSGTPPVGWMATNADQPGRPDPCALLIQSDNAWAQAHIEDDPEHVIAALSAAGSALAGVDLSVASHQVLHRWRYASTPKPAGVPFLIDENQQLAACGDWCPGSKVEAAFLSANALADEILSLPKA